MRSSGWAPVSTSEDGAGGWPATFGAAASTYDTVIPFFAYWGVVLARRARIRPDERVLDVGCGSGASLVPASSVAGWATGLDASVEMLEHVPWPVPLVAGDAARLPLRDATYDVVQAGFVLQFVPDPVAAVAEWARVLRPGGRMVVSLPDPQMPGVGDVQAAWAERLGLYARPPERAETWVEDAMTEAGLVAVERGAEEFTFSFSDGHEYVRWQWSHGGRSFLRAVPDALRPELERDLAAAAEANRDGSTIPMPATARFWSAHRPG